MDIPRADPQRAHGNDMCSLSLGGAHQHKWTLLPQPQPPVVDFGKVESRQRAPLAPTRRRPVHMNAWSCVLVRSSALDRYRPV